MTGSLTSPQPSTMERRGCVVSARLHEALALHILEGGIFYGRKGGGSRGHGDRLGSCGSGHVFCWPPLQWSLVG